MGACTHFTHLPSQSPPMATYATAEPWESRVLCPWGLTVQLPLRPKEVSLTGTGQSEGRQAGTGMGLGSLSRVEGRSPPALPGYPHTGCVSLPCPCPLCCSERGRRARRGVEAAAGASGAGETRQPGNSTRAGGPEETAAQYAVIAIVPIFCLMGLLGILVCNLLKRKGYHCTAHKEAGPSGGTGNGEAYSGVGGGNRWWACSGEPKPRECGGRDRGGHQEESPSLAGGSSEGLLGSTAASGDLGRPLQTDRAQSGQAVALWAEQM